MHDSVKPGFISLISRFEGVLLFMYLDVKGLVTTGIGNLIDPMPYALDLEWVKIDKSPATRIEIAAEWTRIKSLQGMTQRGGGAFAPYTTLRLTNEGLDKLVHDKVDQMSAYLSTRFSGLDKWPADAQLGLLSMAWAAGPAFRAPKFDAACNGLDFDAASKECALHTPRDSENVHLFNNAAKVIDAGSEISVLHYPAYLLPPVEVVGFTPNT